MPLTDDGSADRDYPIGQYIAGLLGGVFVHLPAVSQEHDDAFMKRLASVLRETGDAIDSARAAWFTHTPGRITPKERSECQQEIEEAVVSLVQLELWFDCIAIGK